MATERQYPRRDPEAATVADAPSWPKGGAGAGAGGGGGLRLAFTVMLEISL